VIHVDGPVVTFQVEAHDGTELAARGLHRGRVIRRSFRASRREKA
jgi:fluoroacetyl-CoA thioesterase